MSAQTTVRIMLLRASTAVLAATPELPLEQWTILDGFHPDDESWARDRLKWNVAQNAAKYEPEAGHQFALARKTTTYERLA